jgi:hypothetical protein
LNRRTPSLAHQVRHRDDEIVLGAVGDVGSIQPEALPSNRWTSRGNSRLFLTSDLKERSVGKSAFALIDRESRSFAASTNLVASASPPSKSEVKDILNCASEDHKTNFVRLRDQMHACRQAAPMLAELVAWRSMHGQ